MTVEEKITRLLELIKVNPKRKHVYEETILWLLKEKGTKE